MATAIETIGTQDLGGNGCAGMPPAVCVRNVVKSFPIALSAASWIRYRGAVPRRTALHGISFDVRHGELFGLLGPNGAGKTTLLKMLATLCIPEGGTVLISGIDAAKRPMVVKQKIGLCTSEERSFYFRLTARDNLRFFGALAGLAGTALERRTEEVALLVDLHKALDRRYDTFSSGMRQRLSLARALLADPDILFFDEPTRAVDPLHAHDIRSLIRDYLVTGEHKTAVLATNSLEEAWAICDTVAILQHGRIVAQGPPHILDFEFTRFPRYRITLERSADGLVDALKRAPGVHNAIASASAEGEAILLEMDRDCHRLNDILQIVATSGASVLGIRSEDPQPLDVFVGLTKNDYSS